MARLQIVSTPLQFITTPTGFQDNDSGLQKKELKTKALSEDEQTEKPKIPTSKEKGKKKTQKNKKTLEESEASGTCYVQLTLLTLNTTQNPVRVNKSTH